MKRFYGIYELEYPLYCDFDILGKSFDIALGNATGQVLFPKASASFYEALEKGAAPSTIPGPICPVEELEWGNKEDSFGSTNWGRIMSFPAGLTMVNRVILVFNAETNSPQEVYDHIVSWFERFYMVKDILSRHSSLQLKEKTPTIIRGANFCKTGLLLYSHNEGTKPWDFIPDENGDVFNISVNVPSVEITYDSCLEICRLVNSNKAISFDYLLYLEGLQAYSLKDYKKAVTICAPALEAALLNGLEKYAKEKNIYFFKNLIKKYRMLGGYFSLAKDISMPLPTTTYQKNILDLRNSVIHKGYSPSQQETHRYIEDIRLYLDTFSNGIMR